MRVNYIKGILVLICSLAATLGFSRSKSKGKPHGVYLNLGMYNNGFSDLNEGLGKTEDSDVKNAYNTTFGYIAGNGFMIFANDMTVFTKLLCLLEKAYEHKCFVFHYDKYFL